ncbi:hypothetical protein O9992_27955 [Vibrio lentus]|nr:hypothetical protein [Vibrio lentus]
MSQEQLLSQAQRHVDGDDLTASNLIVGWRTATVVANDDRLYHYARCELQWRH